MSWLLLRREVLLPLLSLLSLTAPLSWPAYSTGLLLLNGTISCLAHVAFRRYQLINNNAAGPRTVVNSLMVMLSVFLQAGELHFVCILLLRLLLRDTSLNWYQSQPLAFCLLLNPK